MTRPDITPDQQATFDHNVAGLRDNLEHLITGAAESLDTPFTWAMVDTHDHIVEHLTEDQEVLGARYATDNALGMLALAVVTLAEQRRQDTL